jgi:FIMAH domain-containing protein
VGQSVTLTDSASDADNVASLSAVLDGTTAISSRVAFNTETLAAGTHTIVITAKDGLGNVSTTTITLTVHATVGGLTTAVNDGVTHLQITSSTVATQLTAYLSSAQSALTAGNHTSAKSYLASFVAYVQGQSGTTINAAYAALLVGWANDLIARL